MTNDNELPDTPCQRWLASLGACQPARTWLGERSILQALDECDETAWLELLAEDLKVNIDEEGDTYWRATTHFREAHMQAVDRAWAERPKGEEGVAAYSAACAAAYAKYRQLCEPADAVYMAAIKERLRPDLIDIAAEWEGA